MVTLALGIVFFVVIYQRRIITHQIELEKINEKREIELMQASILSEESERTRIASELHDDIGATLSSARLFLYKAEGAKYDEGAINKSKDLLNESIQKIRSISYKLQPITLQYLGLEQSLQGLLETLNQPGVIKTSFSIAGNKSLVLSDIVALAIYRIIQELITNITKHALATKLDVQIISEEKAITISIIYNGVGLTQDTYELFIYKKGSTGLKNIINRLKLIDGSIKYNKQDDIYFIVLTIPISQWQ